MLVGPQDIEVSGNSNVLALLARPEFLGGQVVHALLQDHVLFSHDLNFNVTHLSESADHLLNIQREHWLHRHMGEMLSSAPINESFLRLPRDTALEALNSGMTGKCIFLDRLGEPKAMSYWRALAFDGDQVIGVAGLLRPAAVETLPQSMHPSIPLNDLKQRVACLSTVERQVAEFVTAGQLNKNIASSLNVAVRTIETRRSRMMLKLRVRSIPELVRLWLQVQENGL